MSDKLLGETLNIWNCGADCYGVFFTFTGEDVSNIAVECGARGYLFTDQIEVLICEIRCNVPAQNHRRFQNHVQVVDEHGNVREIMIQTSQAVGITGYFFFKEGFQFLMDIFGIRT